MEIVVGDGTLVEVGWLVCSRCSWWGFRPNRPGDHSQFSQDEEKSEKQVQAKYFEFSEKDWLRNVKPYYLIQKDDIRDN